MKRVLVSFLSFSLLSLAVIISPSYAHAQSSRVYVTNPSENDISVIDQNSNSVIATIPVGNDPRGIVVTPDGSKVYVANYDDGTVSVINASTDSVIATIPVGTNPGENNV